VTPIINWRKETVRGVGKANDMNNHGSGVMRLTKSIAIVGVVVLWAMSFAPCLATSYTVKKDGSGDFSSIQSAINASHDGDIITVYQGTYYERIRFNGKNIILQSSDPTDPAVVANTIIDGSNSSSVVKFNGTEDSSCLLSGFTIRKGRPDYGGGIAGGGEFGDHALATVSYCVVTNNRAWDYGAGIYHLDGDIINCTISNNTVSYYFGGGIYQCNGNIIGCTVTGNSTPEEGGGIAACNGDISYTTVSNNHAGDVGGGIYCCIGNITDCVISGNTSNVGGGIFSCDGLIKNTVIFDNTAYDYGGGVDCCDGEFLNCFIFGNNGGDRGGGLLDCDGDMINCTIADNWADKGGGLCNYDANIINCIIWGNSADSGAQIKDSRTPTFSCIQDWDSGGTGNIAADPLFTTGPLGSYYLSNTLAGQTTDSPCIDAGSDTVGNIGLGNYGTRTDGVPDSGIVDMGCHYPADTGAPPWSTATCQQYSSVSPIAVDYTAGDNGCGLKEVTLWYRKDGGSWTSSGLTCSDYSGTFNFVPSGDGLFDFYTIAEDNDGVFENAPALPDCSTAFDTEKPSSECTSDETDHCSPIRVNYTSYDATSGIANVMLWYQFNGGDWMDSGLCSSQTYGYFDFVPPNGDGTYAFVTFAQDKAGNLEDPPAQPDTQTTFEQQDGPVITSILYRTEYSPGSRMDCYLELTNPGPAITVDLYLFIVLPDGSILSFTGSSFVWGIHPWLTDLDLEEGFHWGPGGVLSVYIGSGTPEGTYIYGTALSTPGEYHVIGEESLVEFHVTGS